jgi:membrane protein implicated in regulation of membrane protease activity
MGAAEEHRDDRRRDGTSGAAARARRRDGTSGAAARAAIVAGTGVLVLLGGLAGIAALRHPRTDWSPPWLDVALGTLAALVAIAAMGVVYRLVARSLAAPPQATTTPAEPAATSTQLAHLQVDTAGGRRIIAVSGIEWIEASGNYARIHLAGEAFLYRAPLARLETELDPRFIRVHRSTLVNLDTVRGVEPLPSGDAELQLASGARVRLSRRYAQAFNERTGRGRRDEA